MRQLLPEPGDVPDESALEDVYLHPSGVHLRVNFVTSLDGVVEIEGVSKPLGGPPDRAAFMAMRAVTDAVLVGAGTVRAEDYGPVRFSETRAERRAARGLAGLVPLVVVSGSARLDPQAKMFAGGAPVVVLTTESAGPQPGLEKVAEVVVCGVERVDMHAALAELRSRGYGRILCEGGPTLTASLIDAGVVDELCLTVSPVLAGTGHHRLAVAGGAQGPLRFELTGLLEGEGMLLARYRPA